jgi:hypothetical protein
MNAPVVIYNGKPQPHSWCRWAVNRVKNRNNSTNIRFIGDTGSGKSWSALFMAEQMAKMMNKEIEGDDIYFGIGDVIRKVEKDPPKPGTIFFIDEQQIEGGSGEWMNLRGKAYTAFFSTVRSKRYIIISTMPFADMIIKKVRRFFHLEIETLSVNENAQVVNTKPRALSYHKHKDKTYRMRLIMKIKNPITGKTKSIKIDTWQVPKPSDEIIELYEEKKAKFQQETYSKLVRDLDKFEGKQKEIEPGDSKDGFHVQGTIDKLTEFQRALYNSVAEHPDYTHEELTQLLISKGFNCSPAKITNNIRFMKGKGVIVVKRRKKYK